jgi:outer membrane lipoprotein LolB
MSLVCSYCCNRFFQLKSIIHTVLVNRPSSKRFLSANALTLALAFILASCAAPPQPTVNLNSSAHQLSLEQQQHWMIKGKLGFKSPEKKQSAYLRWQQAPQKYKLNLTSIIGTSLLNMQGDVEGVTLITDDKTYQDSDPSHLIWRVTGWQIPVEKLRFWIKGQHQKNDQVLTSEQGWVSQLRPMCANCKNWLINYDNYKLVDDVWLPHKVVLHNDLNNSQLLIKVNQWDLHE